MNANQCIKIAVYSLDLPHYACADLRIVTPFRKLREHLDFRWAVQDCNGQSRIDAEPAEWADLIVVQRYFPLKETSPLLEIILASGKPVVFEIDDLLLDVPPTHPLFHNFQKTAPFIRQLIPKVDVVTVSTDALRDRLLEFNPNTLTLPNFIDEAAVTPAIPLADPMKTVIAYMGSPTHDQDLKFIEDALFRVKEKFGEATEFIFWGCAGTRLAKLGRVIPFDDSYASFLKSLGKIHFDIGLAPLADNAFNRCKSNIKWLEYSAHARTGIFSDLEPYRESVEHGKTGMLVGDDPKEWFEALEYLISNPDQRKAMGRAARKDAFARFGLSKGVHRYLELYKGLLKR
ncbi:Glycosyltransferase involved in cell wall bisynthesis [Desulfomicrobium apsheronum]|uniref:Glycosyltransferase involved in cell wall bisynthesis n=1 Tax=Desulfomicrobium apsheronum TaxID=52560 RepID=A0A1I3TPZ1_9BACT|nr:glycosyltransferase [Desulfomicrobium apsheronum]SFJ73288.1 Glycosyltransferase involved in cell wall bisynthesis [Desulfomicrobium apsheronum]